MSHGTPSGRRLGLMVLVLAISSGPITGAFSADQWMAPGHNSGHTGHHSDRVTEPKDARWQSSSFTRSRRRSLTGATLDPKTISAYRQVDHAEPVDGEGAGPDLLPAPQGDSSLDTLDPDMFDVVDRDVVVGDAHRSNRASSPAELPAPSEGPRTAPTSDRAAPGLPALLPAAHDTYTDRDSLDKELREEYQGECQQSLAALRGKKLADISLDITVDGTPGTDYPRTCATGTNQVPLADLHSGKRAQVDVAWTASGLCHKPLYFEETNLERYGHTAGPLAQPVVSAAHFFGTLPVLPYKMGLKPPGECVYTLGHYRPGDCAPHYIPAVPLSLRAGLVQAGAMVGAAAILP